jgi:hypothetical protein
MKMNDQTKRNSPFSDLFNQKSLSQYLNYIGEQLKIRKIICKAKRQLPDVTKGEKFFPVGITDISVEAISLPDMLMYIDTVSEHFDSLLEAEISCISGNEERFDFVAEVEKKLQDYMDYYANANPFKIRYQVELLVESNSGQEKAHYHQIEMGPNYWEALSKTSLERYYFFLFLYDKVSLQSKKMLAYNYHNKSDYTWRAEQGRDYSELELYELGFALSKSTQLKCRNGKTPEDFIGEFMGFFNRTRTNRRLANKIASRKNKAIFLEELITTLEKSLPMTSEQNSSIKKKKK